MKRTFYITSILAALSCYAGDKHKDKDRDRDCPTIDVADVRMNAHHSYRLMVADGAKPWRQWAIIRPTSNTQARIWFPLASTRPIQWQLVDTTPGWPVLAVEKKPADCDAKPSWVVLGVGNVRPVK
jgi:hypothetical protein